MGKSFLVIILNITKLNSPNLTISFILVIPNLIAKLFNVIISLLYNPIIVLRISSNNHTNNWALSIFILILNVRTPIINIVLGDFRNIYSLNISHYSNDIFSFLVEIIFSSFHSTIGGWNNNHLNSLIFYFINNILSIIRSYNKKFNLVF